MTLKREMIVWIAALLGCLVACSAVQARERLVISQTGGGQWVGQTVALRLLRTAYREVGITISGKGYPAERAVVMADRGKAAGILARMEGLESMYPNLVRVPVPVAYLDMMCYTRGASFWVSGWESLRPYRIVFMRGDKLMELNTAGMDVTAVTTPEQAFKMLAAGRADVAVEPRDVWFSMKSMDREGIRMMEPPLAKLPMYHYLNRRHEHLVPRLTALLKRLHDTGVFRTIEEEETRRFMAARLE